MRNATTAVPEKTNALSISSIPENTLVLPFMYCIMAYSPVGPVRAYRTLNPTTREISRSRLFANPCSISYRVT